MPTIEFSAHIPFVSGFSVLRRPQAIGLKPKEVFLAFDDGPNPSFKVTTRLLDVLNQEQIQATFCLIGVYTENHPCLVRRMYHEGHTIAFHGTRHILPWWRNSAKILQEIDRFTQSVKVLCELPQYTCRYYRPPYGVFFPAIESTLLRQGMRIVPLTFYLHDAWIRPNAARNIMHIMLTKIKQEQCAAVVIHERLAGKHLEATTVLSSQSPFNQRWVPQEIHWLIGELKQAGYTFVGMPELAARYSDGT